MLCRHGKQYLSNKQMNMRLREQQTFHHIHLKCFLSSLWCGNAGNCCCRADTAAHPSAGVVGWNKCWVVIDAHL